MRQQLILSHADAMLVIEACRRALEADGRGAVVAVADEHGELLALLRTDGAPLPSIVIAQNKAFTAARERKPSLAVGQASRHEGFPMTNFGDLRYTAWGGGVPIVVEGQVVGAVGVSGLPEMDDVAIAEAGIRALLDALAQG
ncbi:MAG: GlcG/HbpS family heme-binding protein [Candidatus Flexifilum sp.]|jgi:glc operon protein GlcG